MSREFQLAIHLFLLKRPRKLNSWSSFCYATWGHENHATVNIHLATAVERRTIMFLVEVYSEIDHCFLIFAALETIAFGVLLRVVGFSVVKVIIPPSFHCWSVQRFWREATQCFNSSDRSPYERKCRIRLLPLFPLTLACKTKKSNKIVRSGKINITPRWRLGLI